MFLKHRNHVPQLFRSASSLARLFLLVFSPGSKIPLLRNNRHVIGTERVVYGGENRERMRWRERGESGREGIGKNVQEKQKRGNKGRTKKLTVGSRKEETAGLGCCFSQSP